MRKLLAVLLFLSICPFALSQTIRHHQILHWIRYQNQLILNDHLYFNNEVDNRRFIPDAQSQFIFHSRLHYKNNRWDFGAGLTGSWMYSALPEKPVSHATFEWRPVIEANYEIPFKRWQLQQRIRIDNRFIEADRFSHLNGEYNFTARLRYRLQTRIILKKKNDTSKIALKVGNEIMINHEGNFFDQNRLYLNTDFHLSKSFLFEIGYISIYQQRRNRNEFYNRDVIRLSLLHKIKINKS